MLQKIKKFLTITQRDGLMFTVKRTIAYLVSQSPFAFKLSFSYYKGVRLYFSPALLTYSIFASPDTRQHDISVFEKHIKSGDTVIDVGANIGSLTLVAAKLTGPQGKVICFEPSPRFSDIIKNNINLNNFSEFVSVQAVALGKEPHTVYLNEQVADDTTNHIDTFGTSVRQVTLDSCTKELEKVDFLKIDVEGYELEVLKGSSETIQKTKCLYIEFISNNLIQASADPKEIIKLLKLHFSLHYYKNDLLSPFTYNPDEKYSLDLIGLAL